MRRIVVLVSLALAFFLTGGCHEADAGSRTTVNTGSAQEPPPSIVRLSTPERIRFAPKVLTTGSLRAQQQTSLSFSLSGTLQRMAVKRGQLVAEGALLASLDSDQARAAVAQAEAGVGAASAQLRLAEDALARMTVIRKEDGISESQLVQAQAQRDLAAAQQMAARAQLEQARVNLSHHQLRAPFAGVITKVPDGTGMAVSPGTAVITLEATSTLILETSLTQEEASGVRAGAPVSVVVPATGARTDGAKVRVVVPSVDPATNRVPLEIEVPNPDGRFLPHAFARAQFPSGTPVEALRVPNGSLTQRDGNFSIWMAGSDGKARTFPIRMLEQQVEHAMVSAEGWPSGARVIETPPLGLTEGTLVVAPEGAP